MSFDPVPLVVRRRLVSILGEDVRITVKRRWDWWSLVWKYQTVRVEVRFRGTTRLGKRVNYRSTFTCPANEPRMLEEGWEHIARSVETEYGR
jgi:hypothetical protein